MKLEVIKAFWPEAVGVFRLSFFSNEEGLIETAGPKRLLRLTESLQLHYGLRDAAEADSLLNLFGDQVGRVAGLVLVWVMGGFPEGKQALPLDEYSSRNLEIEGKSFRVSAKRAGENEIAFRVVGPNWHVEGVWGMKKPVPWPDSAPLGGWTAQNGKTFSNLGEARKQAKEWSR